MTHYEMAMACLKDIATKFARAWQDDHEDALEMDLEQVRFAYLQLADACLEDGNHNESNYRRLAELGLLPYLFATPEEQDDHSWGVFLPDSAYDEADPNYVPRETFDLLSGGDPTYWSRRYHTFQEAVEDLANAAGQTAVATRGQVA